MADYHIRMYKDTDYETVRDLFANGLKEQAPALRKYAMKLPRTKFFLLAVLLALIWSFTSFSLSVLQLIFCLVTCLFGVLVVVCFGANHIFASYVHLRLREDMLDIQAHYVQKEGACFWVAESNGKVVGLVAAEPYYGAGGGKKVELKRLSVSKACRGCGIGKALCRTVISFARQEGCEGVILETTMVQYSGLKLYENLGFRRINFFTPPTFVHKLFYFVVLRYRYDILSHN
ncbi:probable N-acetyltransferase camello [Ambystoma mexicanum]|uniref:probable N-acetyltransferase camello n=1 Tax=Ambystoma mexicanum TaxID=8296 RepID=UPI0037E79651